MTIAIVLAIVALILIYLEFFMPGGVFAISGAISAIASIVFFSFADPGTVWVVVFSIALIVGIVFACSIGLKHLRMSGKSNTFLSSSDQEGYAAATTDEELIGKKGKTLTDLKPAGHILVGDKRLQAVSESGYISKDQEVVILRGDGAHYVVKKGEDHDTDHSS